MTDVQRFVARVKPHRDHPLYYEWQTAIVCIFIGENNQTLAERRADEEIRRRFWERIEFIDRSTLIEERVRAEGGEVIDAFRQARAGVPFFIEECDEVPFATKDSPPVILAPRLSEAFVDQVVLSAGGERLDADQSRPDRPKTADYKVGDVVWELKDLQTDSLEVVTRQAKLAKLFASKLRPDRSAIIDHRDLSDDEKAEYVKIVGDPIRKRLVDAGQQVRATLHRSPNKHLRGGAILLNTGYGSLSAELLAQIAQDYSSRSSTIKLVICVSAWTITNGMDTETFFAFDPQNSDEPSITALRDAFRREVSALMNDWARNGFTAPAAGAEPRRPIVFETEEGVFSIVSPKPRNSIERT